MQAKRSVLINYIFFDIFFLAKKLFKNNVKLCWNKSRLNLGIFIGNFLIMVLLSHLSNSSSLFFRLIDK